MQWYKGRWFFLKLDNCRKWECKIWDSACKMRKDCTVVTFGVSQGVGGLWKSSAKVSERALDNFTTYQTGKASGWCTHWLLTFRPIKSSQYIEINIDHLWPSQVLLIYFVLHLLFYNLKLNEHCIVPLCKGNYQCSQGTLVIPLPRFVPRGKDIRWRNPGSRNTCPS